MANLKIYSIATYVAASISRVGNNTNNVPNWS